MTDKEMHLFLSSSIACVQREKKKMDWAGLNWIKLENKRKATFDTFYSNFLFGYGVLAVNKLMTSTDG